jgi:arsenate reductase (thioredoxin)
MSHPVKVLFVCAANSCRSQMAEALARSLAADVIAPASAGIAPSGSIDEHTEFVLLQRGILMPGQFSKGMRDSSLALPQMIVNMSGIPGEALFKGRPFEDWKVEAPTGDDLESYRRACEDIEARVTDLANRLRVLQPDD